MATIRAKLKELRNADVRFISLVDRAASRIPFRVLKRDKESEMSIDLMKVFKTDVVKPEVAAVVVFATPDTAVTERIRQSIATAGFHTNRVRKSDGGETLVYSQGDQSEEGLQMVRLSDQMIAVVKGLGTPTGFFQDVVERHGFYPGLEMATQTMQDRMAEIITKSEKPVEDTRAVTESFDAYLQLLTSLPSACFKADSAVNAVVVKAQEESKETVTVKNPTPVVEKEVEKVVETKEVPGLQANGTTVTTVVKAEGTPEEKVVTEPTSETKILEALSGVTATLETLTKKVDGIATEQDAQKKVLDETVQKADTLQKTLASTVTAPAGGEDRPSGRQEVKKQDDDPRTGNFDTAFLRRRR